MKQISPEKFGLRLQVFLSRSGVCSRREALKFIQEGCVSLNGKTEKEPSTLINPEKDEIVFRGKIIKEKPYTYILLNKPKGFVTTVEDRYAKKTVLDLLPGKFRHLRPTGRLDKDTEGLLLLTNDGELIYRLTHPSFNVEKTYFVRATGQLKNSSIRRLERGVRIERKLTHPAKISSVRYLKNKTEFLIVIHEGRKRQIRRMVSIVGHKVLDLRRIKQGPLTLKHLEPGKWRLLNKQEILELKAIQ